ncbi:MAG: aldo/keto reductase [Jatrophihabitans sp.]
MTEVPTIRLNNGVEIPQLGFGVFQVPPAETQIAVEEALKAGYRHIDTAEMYENEEGVGAAIAGSDVARDDIFITSKLNNSNHGRDAALAAFDGTLKALGIERIDLFLIHWPLPSKGLFVETWQALEEVYREGRARAIGVSNFSPHHLGRILAETDVVPTVNQIELHPFLTQSELRGYDADHEIATEAWSPLGGQGGAVLSDPTIGTLAEKHGKTPAQVVIRWHLELGNIVIPKSAKPARMAENFDVFDFEIAPEDHAMITGLDRGGRVGPDPDHFNPS